MKIAGHTMGTPEYSLEEAVVLFSDLGFDGIEIIWDDADDPAGNVRHISEHGLTVGEVEFVLENPETETTSRSTGRPCCFGYTPAGEYIIVVYEQIEDDAVYPVTAYRVPGP